MLMRYDPFREIDRFTEGLFGNANRSPWMPMDAYRRGDHVEVLFDLPGVRPDSIELTVEKNVLTVKAERHHWPEEGVEVLARERTQGAFSRQVLLGDALDAEGIDAALRPRSPPGDRPRRRAGQAAQGRDPHR